MDSETFRPTVGIFNRCTKLQLNFQIAKVRDNCATFVVEFMAEDDYFPHAWKACVILFAIAGTFLIFAMLCSVMSLFVRSICGKSIFNVAGFIQSIGGLFSVVGLVVYPVGWGTKRVRDLCGEYADPYVIDSCTIGWSYYLGIAATVLVFITAVLSVPADRSTTSRKVEEEMLEGKNLICVLWCHFRINITRYLSDFVFTLTDTCSHMLLLVYISTKLCYKTADSRVILKRIFWIRGQILQSL